MKTPVELKGKKILVIGGCGFIGSNLAEKCLQAGAEITIYDNLDPNAGGNLFNLESFNDKVELVTGDIGDFYHLIQFVVKKDIIINCAAITSHAYSMREPWINLDVNGRGVINILETIRRVNRDAKFVHIGTTTQLGNLHYMPADEFHPEFPTDMYSANKVVAEKFVLLYARTYGLQAAVIRLPNVFGPRAAIHSPDFTYNNYFIGLALQNKPITVYKPGTQLRNVLYVDDAVEALLMAMVAENVIPETFFAVGDEHYSVREIAEQTCSIIGGSVEMVDWPKARKAIEFGDAVISNQKIKNAWSWSPITSLKDGLVKTRDYYTTCLEKYLK